MLCTGNWRWLTAASRLEAGRGTETAGGGGVDGGGRWQLLEAVDFELLLLGQVDLQTETHL